MQLVLFLFYAGVFALGLYQCYCLACQCWVNCHAERYLDMALKALGATSLTYDRKSISFGEGYNQTWCMKRDILAVCYSHITSDNAVREVGYVRSTSLRQNLSLQFMYRGDNLVSLQIEGHEISLRTLALASVKVRVSEIYSILHAAACAYGE